MGLSEPRRVARFGGGLKELPLGSKGGTLLPPPPGLKPRSSRLLPPGLPLRPSREPRSREADPLRAEAYSR